MSNEKIIARTALVLSILVIIGLLLSVGALADIRYNRETDLSSQWATLRYTFLLALMHIVVSGAAIVRFLRKSE